MIEARYGEGVRADLYVEGSDQHRGWFQSSLLESSGTRGRAPYKSVLTHGFALDGQGRKMSKSIGNVVDPLAIIRDNGADILRLWVASTDYFEDVRIGKEVLAGTSDAYRKLRNTFRYLLGALDGFTDAEKVAPAEMPELERWVLHRLAELDAELQEAAEGYEFNRYARALTAFANDDLSAFFFDIRKDSLYCDAPGDSEAPRLSHRARHDLPRAGALAEPDPLLHRRGGLGDPLSRTRGSVHLLEWPEIDAGWRDEALGAKWDADPRDARAGHREHRAAAARQGDRLQPGGEGRSIPISELGLAGGDLAELAEIFIVSEVVPGARRRDRRDANRLSEMRPLLAPAARSGGRRRSVRALRGGGEWLSGGRSGGGAAGEPAPELSAADRLRLKALRAAALVIAFLIFVFDQAMKWVVTYPLNLRASRTGRSEITDFFDLRWVENNGVSLGLLSASSFWGAGCWSR